MFLVLMNQYRKTEEKLEKLNLFTILYKSDVNYNNYLIL